MNNPRKLTLEEWEAEGKARFGSDMEAWAYQCPSCGRVARAADWRAAGSPPGGIGFSCIGRWIDGAKQAFDKGPNDRGCTYAGGGLFKLNPLFILMPSGETLRMFEWAPVVVEVHVTEGGL